MQQQAAAISTSVPTAAIQNVDNVQQQHQPAASSVADRATESSMNDINRQLAGGSKLTEYTFKILVIGNPNVGKTQILNGFHNEKFSQHSTATIGVEYKYRELTVDDKNIRVNTWDTAGQERFKSISTSYFRNTDGCIIVYDLTDQASFTALNNWLQLLRENEDSQCPVSVMIVGNKSDLLTDLTECSKPGMQYALQNNFLYHITSALDKSSIESAFNSLIRHMIVADDKLNKEKIDNAREIMKTINMMPVEKTNCLCFNF
ncbi:MAG: hypothetical protein MHMPM18_001445 [Marteilia pararefringens]